MKILLNVPNLMGYCRLILAIFAWCKWDNPTLFLSLFIASSILDFFDGMVARYLNQTSVFGAWLDVTLDNLTRGMIWGRLYPDWGFIVISVEWLTFVCTHQLGGNWKTPTKQHPKLVSLVMANNFNTPLGLWAISSVWFLPVWLYCLRFSLISSTMVSLLGSVVLVLGRCVAFLVESWFILQHIKKLLNEG